MKLRFAGVARRKPYERLQVGDRVRVFKSATGGVPMLGTVAPSRCAFEKVAVLLDGIRKSRTFQASEVQRLSIRPASAKRRSR